MTNELIELQSPLAALPLAQAEGGGGDMFTLLLLVGATIMIFYFFMIRPERMRKKHMQEMIDALKKNDKVMTSAGIIGWVQRIKENEVVLKVDEKTGATMTVVRHAIGQVLDVAAGSASSEKDADDESDEARDDKASEPTTAASSGGGNGGGGGGTKGKGKKGKR